MCKVNLKEYAASTARIKEAKENEAIKEMIEHAKNNPRGKEEGKKTFKMLTLDDRRIIERMYNARQGKRKVFTKEEIAIAVGVHFTTIYREIKKGLYMHRLSDWTEEERYAADGVQRKADLNKKKGGRKIKLDFEKDKDFIEYIQKGIKNKYHSPAELTERIKRNGLPMLNVCFKTLYRYIHKGIIKVDMKDMPIGVYKKSEYKKTTPRKRGIPFPGLSIEKRGESVLTRKDFGHWEMDCVVGRQGVSKQALLVMTERKTRAELIYLLPEHKAECVVTALDTLEFRLGGLFKSIFSTITVDNGSEFADAAGIMKSVFSGNRTALYYCHPRCSFERGTNENSNRPIRRKIPKGTDLDKYNEKQVARIQKWMNGYFRKILDWKSPKECVLEEMLNIGINGGELKKVMDVLAA